MSFILWSQSQAGLQRGNHYFVNNAQFMHSKEAGISTIINTTKKHANKGYQELQEPCSVFA
jgi:hypothetical protein